MKNYPAEDVFLYPLDEHDGIGVLVDPSMCWCVSDMADSVIAASKDFIVNDRSGDIIRYSSCVNEGLLLLFMHSSFIYFSSNQSDNATSFVSVSHDFSMRAPHRSQEICDTRSPSCLSQKDSKRNKNEGQANKPILDCWSDRFSSIFSYFYDGLIPRDDQKSSWQLLRYSPIHLNITSFMLCVSDSCLI